MLEIWLAIISMVQAITLAFIPSIRKNSKSTNEQVKNTHEINLRDNLDINHVETLNKIESVKTDLTASIDSVKEDIKGTKKDIGRLDDRDLEHSRHHRHTDKELREIRINLQEHLDWSKDFISEYEKTQETGK